MANSRKCERCGANLDFGERCSCVADVDSNNMSNDEKYYRTYPERNNEQILDQLNAIKALVN